MDHVGSPRKEQWLLDGSSEDRIVRLNIGGVRYWTTKETLCKGGDNYFTSLLSGRFPALKDEQGFYFIDRDGEYFKPLLEWLRTGDYSIPDNMRREAVQREAEFFNINIPLPQQLKKDTRQDALSGNELHHDGFYLPVNISDQRGILSNTAMLHFRPDSTGCFCDTKEFTYKVTRYATQASDSNSDLRLLTLTYNNLPYNFLFMNGRLSDGSSEFRYFRPEDVHMGMYFNGYLSIPETNISAILFGDDHIFLRFSKRILVRIGSEKSSLNAGLFETHSKNFHGFPTYLVDITVCKAASSETQEALIQILPFRDFLLVRDLKSASGSFYVFHVDRGRPILRYG